MNTYTILADFFLEDGSRNLSWQKIKSLNEAVERNGVTPLGLSNEPGNVPQFLFNAKRKDMIGLVFDLVHRDGILESELLDAFDDAFETI